LKGEVAETGMVMHRSDYFRFGSVFIKKKLPNRNLFLKKIIETGSNRQVSVRFGFFDKNLFKPVGSVFPVWLGFLFLALFFRFGSVFFWFGSGFFWFGSGFFWVFSSFGSVWFFQFQAYKTETEPNRSVFSKF
jgi:hypothetical protein